MKILSQVLIFPGLKCQFLRHMSYHQRITIPTKSRQLNQTLLITGNQEGMVIRARRNKRFYEQENISVRAFSSFVWNLEQEYALLIDKPLSFNQRNLKSTHIYTIALPSLKSYDSLINISTFKNTHTTHSPTPSL